MRPRLGKVRLATWVRPEVRRALQAFCKRRREKVNVVLERAVEREVAAEQRYEAKPYTLRTMGISGHHITEWSPDLMPRTKR